MATTVRAHGRNLADFSPLHPAEQLLLAATARGELASLGQERPETPTDQNIVRAGFIRFLALGGDETAPVHEHGVQLRGVWIEGELDLRGAETTGGIVLHQCHFLQRPNLLAATIGGLLSLDGSFTRVLPLSS